MDGDVEFKKWCIENNLSAGIVTALEENGFQRIDDVTTITAEDLQELGLKMADRNKLRRALQPFWDQQQKVYENVPRSAASDAGHYDHDWASSEDDDFSDDDVYEDIDDLKVTDRAGAGAGAGAGACGRFAALLGDATLLNTGPPAHYKLRVQETARCEGLCVRKCEFGQASKLVQQKSFLMIGETGSGKSTMIDAIINHVVGVQLADELRFHIIDSLSDETKARASDSQTDWITCYTVHPIPGGRIPYTLNIVDTPGFGDTRGMERDRLIVDQIKELFESEEDHGIDTLHAVCYVIKSATNRLTVSQRYVLDSVLAVFGKDMKDNIYIMCSFSDSENPPALAALNDENVPYIENYSFNNVWMDRTSGDVIGKLYWEAGEKNFKKFFNELKVKSPKSLKLSAEVMQERRELEECVEGLDRLISTTAGKLALMRTMRSAVEVQRSTKIEVPVAKMVKKKTKDRNLNCATCENSCKMKCGTLDRVSRKVKSKKSKCKVCDCEMRVHKIDKFKFEWETKSAVCSFAQLQRNAMGKGDSTDGGELTLDDTIARMKGQENELIQRVDHQLDKMNRILKRLDEIALRPQMSSIGDYIEMVIKREEVERKPGYDQRVAMLKKLQKMYEMIGDASAKRLTSADFLSTVDF